MKVLFVNPYIYDFSAFDLWLRPLGLLYLVSVVKNYTDADVYWIDTLDRAASQEKYKFGKDGRGKYDRIEVEKPEIYRSVPRQYSRYGMPLDIFEKKINEMPADIDIIFVTSLMTYWVDGVNFTVFELEKKFPGAKIFVGGILPTLLKKKSNDYLKGDFFIEGYGEDKILDIINEFGGKVNSGIPDLNNINNLPFPAVDFLHEKEVLPLITSKGCPFLCSYCASNLLNKNFVEREPDLIYREIVKHHEEFGTEHFVIFDDAFLINKKERFFKVFEQIAEKFNINFHTPNGIHAKEINRETAEIMYRSGFKTIRLSYESTDSSILSKSSDKVSIQQMNSAIENLINAGFKYGDIESYLLFGMYKQSIESIENSLDFTKKLKVIPRLSYYSPVPGTVDFLNLQKKGVISNPVDLYETNKLFFTYKKSGLTEKQIREITDRTLKIGREIRT